MLTKERYDEIKAKVIGWFNAGKSESDVTHLLHMEAYGELPPQFLDALNWVCELEAELGRNGCIETGLTNAKTEMQKIDTPEVDVPGARNFNEAIAIAALSVDDDALKSRKERLTQIRNAAEAAGEMVNELFKLAQMGVRPGSTYFPLYLHPTQEQIDAADVLLKEYRSAIASRPKVK